MPYDTVTERFTSHLIFREFFFRQGRHGQIEIRTLSYIIFFRVDGAERIAHHRRETALRLSAILCSVAIMKERRFISGCSLARQKPPSFTKKLHIAPP